MPLHTKYLSLPELRFYVSRLNEKSHPSFVWRLLVQCRYQVEIGTSWYQIETSEVDMLTLLHVCHRRQMIRELKAILAKNSQRPLDFNDAELLSYLLDDLSRYNVDWNELPVSPNGLREIIELAACGYQHTHQQMS